MTTTHTLTVGENARVHLTITVPAETVQAMHATELHDIAKKAQIKGFRKGKVPLKILEDKFGDSLKANTLEKIINNSVQDVLQKVEKQPLPYSRPSLQEEQNLELIANEDFVFTILYDTNPIIEPCDVKALSLPDFDIQISDEDIAKELEGIQERNAIMSDKTSPIENSDVVTMTLVELEDNDEEIAGTKREDFTATVGSHQTLYDIDDDLLDLSVKQSKIVSKKFAKDYKISEFAGKSIKLKIVIQAVKQKNLPDIDDELAQDVNAKYKTLDELKQDLEKQLKDRSQYMIEELHKKKIMDHLLESSKIEVPESAVKFQLENFWKSFVSNNGNDENAVYKSLQMSGQSKEQIFEMWRENAIYSVKEQLMMGHLIKANNIVIDDDTMWNVIKEECEKTGMNFEEVKEYYTKQQMLPRIRHDIEQKKLFEILKNSTTIEVEKKKMSFLELVAFYEKNQQSVEKAA